MIENKYKFENIDTKRLYAITFFSFLCYFFVVPRVVKALMLILGYTKENQIYDLVGNLICFVIMSLVLVITLYGYLKESIYGLEKYRFGENFKWILKGWGYYFVINVTLSVGASFLYKILGWNLTTVSANQKSIEMWIESGRVLVIIIACILAPFIEEIIFRGLLYRSIRKLINVPSALIISSALFAMVHMITEIINLDISHLLFWFIRYFANAMSFGILYEKRKNILVCIIFHGSINLVPTLIHILS